MEEKKQLKDDEINVVSGGSASGHPWCEIDFSRCNSCMICVSECWLGANAVKVAPDGETLYIDRELCTGCMACMGGCETDCIIYHES